MCRRSQAKIQDKDKQASNKEDIEMVGFFEIYKYCTPKEKFLAFSGMLASVVAGAAAPWVSIIMGQIITIFQPTATADEVHEGILYLLKMVSIVGAV